MSQSPLERRCGMTPSGIFVLGPGEEAEELEEELQEVESTIADLAQRRLEIQGELEAIDEEEEDFED